MDEEHGMHIRNPETFFSQENHKILFPRKQNDFTEYWYINNIFTHLSAV